MFEQQDALNKIWESLPEDAQRQCEDERYILQDMINGYSGMEELERFLIGTIIVLAILVVVVLF